MANNSVNTATRYISFYLNSGEQPIVLSTFLGMHGMRQVVPVQEMVDQLKMALESAKANLTTAQIRMKEYVDRLRRSKVLCKGTEVLLSIRNLRVNIHLPSKL